jgi:hypothetical protein
LKSTCATSKGIDMSTITTGPNFVRCYASIATVVLAVVAINSSAVASDGLPDGWGDAQLCRPSHDAKAPALVIVYVPRLESPGSRYVVRAQLQGPLPGYVDRKAGWLADTEREVAPDEGVGYIDVARATFVLPSGTKLTCENSVSAAVVKRSAP